MQSQFQLRSSIFCVLSLLGMLPAAAVRGQDADPKRSEQMIQGLHEQLDELSAVVGGLAADQKTQLSSIESSIGEKIKADPNATPATLREEVIGEFRAILTTDQQKKFDDILAQSRKRAVSIHDSSNLKQIGLALQMYADQHKGALPADQGALVQIITGGQVFLTTDSKTKVPDGFDQLDAATRANWVNKNSEFIYLGRGKPLDTLPYGTVVAYIKPEVATLGNSLLMADGAVYHEEPAAADKIIAELTAGKNPPPSLDTTVHVPSRPSE